MEPGRQEEAIESTHQPGRRGRRSFSFDSGVRYLNLDQVERHMSGAMTHGVPEMVTPSAPRLAAKQAPRQGAINPPPARPTPVVCI